MSEIFRFLFSFFPPLLQNAQSNGLLGKVKDDQKVVLVPPGQISTKEIIMFKSSNFLLPTIGKYADTTPMRCYTIYAGVCMYSCQGQRETSSSNTYGTLV